MRLWRFSGVYLIATGIIHKIVALIIARDIFVEMIKDGMINSTAGDYSRAFAFWFLIIGVILVLWGATLQYYIDKEQKPAPKFLGYAILLFAIIGCVLEPISGFWLFLPQAFIIIFPGKHCVQDQVPLP